jgi:hypothetical protein
MAAAFGSKLTLNSHPNPPAAATQPRCGLGAVYDNRKSETDVPEGFELRNAVSARQIGLDSTVTERSTDNIYNL